MVIVKLTGGMGNQMFQYALGRCLAYKNNTSLELDIIGFGAIESDTPRKYELDVFGISALIAAPDEIKKMRGREKTRLERTIYRLSDGLIPIYGRRHIVERHFYFDPGILNLRSDFYLDGYWQSEKYFKDIEGIIRKEFTVKAAPDFANKEIADKISKCNAVSIHIRRGDYAYSPATNEYHGLCSLSYYENAVNIITKNVNEPSFFIFSDDPEWVKENLKLKYPVFYVDHNGPEKAYEDMRLMSLCKHHIIANSSFSWWGAWLSANSQKIVVAPKKWFNNPKIDAGDLIPQTWRRI